MAKPSLTLGTHGAFIFFFIMVTLISGLVTTYLYRKLYRQSPFPVFVRRLILIFLAISISLQFIGPAIYRSGRFEVRGVFLGLTQWTAYALMGMICYLIFYSAIHDTFGIGSNVFQRLKKRTRAQSTNAQEANSTTEIESRRHFLTNAAHGSILLASSASTAVGWAQATSGPEVRRVEIPIAGLPDAWDGLKIAQISDLHVGPTIDRNYASQVVDQVLSLNPDLIALTGDFVDGTVAQLRDEVAPLGRLKAPHGVYFCTGNHEYFSGVKDWIDAFTDLGFRCLGNRHEVLEIRGHRMVIAGVHDYSSQRFDPLHRSDPWEAIKGAPPDAALRVLLAHQPKSIIEATDAGFDLQLSGHTHNGQFFPVNLLVHLVQPYVKGLNLHQGSNGKKAWIYVNVGTGYWGPPVRLGVPSEISLLALKKA